eukprot:gnl/Dysnectes_brevis/9708_a18347_158.p1 GENE.gnl/Dysnectes_brevis/9708_a18347_158~~gnl/Dysnectes_brevis/9708_a18347_158.p1  ORF type:complete len:185 (-),score=19.95 gnl/Dysnectes_brevis/9708_a18347_158:10-564(-)
MSTTPSPVYVKWQDVTPDIFTQDLIIIDCTTPPLLLFDSSKFFEVLQMIAIHGTGRVIFQNVKIRPLVSSIKRIMRNQATGVRFFRIDGFMSNWEPAGALTSRTPQQTDHFEDVEARMHYLQHALKQLHEHNTLLRRQSQMMIQERDSLVRRIVSLESSLEVHRELTGRDTSEVDPSTAEGLWE